MKYELAKKLKDAGFPQKFIFPDDLELKARVAMARDEDIVTYPNLSELIEACGDGFEYLNRVHGGGWVAGTHDTPIEGTLGVSNFENGTTPEEAVANLWLALHSKNV